VKQTAHFATGEEFFRDLRDAHVRNSLFERYKDEPEFKGFRNTIESLLRLNRENVLALEKQLIKENSIFDNLKESVKADQSVSAYLETMSGDRSCLFSGIIRSFEKSHKACFASYLHPASDMLHEWRKRVKDLQHQLVLMHHELPAEYTSMRADIDQLSELLGTDQDLYNLIIWINDIPESIPESEIKALLSYLKSRRNRLKGRIEYLGKSLYHGDPDLFKKSLLKHAGL
jgi:CHAD domain-containing protein